MAIRSAASVATAVKRRGAGALGVEAFMWLQKNSGEVEEVISLLDNSGERAGFAERKATDAEAVATRRLAEANKAEGALDERTAAFEKSTAETLAKQQADMEVLGHRADKVREREDNATAREVSLDAGEASLTHAKAKLVELTDGLRKLGLEQAGD